MASSSKSSQSRCTNTQCRNLVEIPRPGWKRHDQEVALCYKCFIAYTRKQYCYIYHKDSSSWGSCKTCNKKLHLSCEVSQGWFTMEDGEIRCNACASPVPTLVPNDVQETSTPTPVLASDANTDQIHDHEENLVEAHPSVPLAPESNGRKSSNKARAQVHSGSEKRRSGTSRTDELYRNTPRMTDAELEELVKGLNAVVVPLFEKMLTVSDTGKAGRLVLPKKCAEKFFPRVDDAQGRPIQILDSKGKEWAFILKMWPNDRSKMYLLDGFEPYVKSMNLVEGDTVTFSKLEPDGKLVLGNRKVSREDDLSRAKKGKAIATTSKHVSKRKTTSTTRKSSGDWSKRKTFEVGSTSKSGEKRKKMVAAAKRSLELVDSPCDSSVPSGPVVGKRRQRTSNKGKTSAKHFMAMKGNEKLNTSRNVQGSARNAKKRTLDQGPSEQVETVQVMTPLQHTLTLSPLRWFKKHPYHRTGCGCKECTRPLCYKNGSTSSLITSPAVVLRPTEQQSSPSSDTMVASGQQRSNMMDTAEPRSSNIDGQMTTNESSEHHQDSSNLLGSDSKGPTFDLNLALESDEDQ